MALPSNSGSKADLPAQAWDAIRNIAGQVKVNSANLRNDSAAGDVAADRVVRYVALLAEAISNLPRWTQVPGLLPYVREQLDAPTFDIVSEYNAMLAQIVACRDWIIANFPKDGAGYLLYHQFNAGGRVDVRQLTTAQLAGLRAQLDNLIATID